ncbi:MAG: hypothetical protein CMJ31_09270 [Phycisphaerae bacterium]|nr:hypothetical protein [Phycisphaerae bacterium]
MDGEATRGVGYSPTVTSIPPSLPFHLAKTYGVSAPAGGSARPSAASSRPVARAVGGTSQTPTVSELPSLRASKAVRSLIAARVPAEGVAPSSVAASSFASSSFASSGGASGGGIPFYRNPADQNAAATAIDVGRSLDVEG